VPTLRSSAEKAFCVLALLMLSGALLPILRPTSDVYQGDPVAQAMWSGIYLTALLFGIVRLGTFLRTVGRNKFLLFLVAMAIISVLWSAAPEVTLRRSIALAGTTVFGFYFASCYSLREQLRLLAWALGIAAFLSLLFVLALPSYGISSDPVTLGDWQGVYGHKNALGKAMLLGVVVFFILGASSRRYRWFAWACCGLSFGLVLPSNSVTALIIALTILLLWPIYKALRWSNTAVVPFLILALLVGASMAIILWVNTGTILSILGRNVTISGRTQLWHAVIDAISERLWLGYGYNGFWLGWQGGSAQVWLATGQPYDNAQNAILGLWLELGLLGVVVFVIVLLRSLFRAVNWARFTTTAEGIWPLAFMTFFVLNGLVENVVLGSNSLAWVLFVAICASPIYPDHRDGGILHPRKPPTEVARARAAV
jgi:exopolysaccharide production protein ExoQ